MQQTSFVNNVSPRGLSRVHPPDTVFKIDSNDNTTQEVKRVTYATARSSLVEGF